MKTKYPKQNKMIKISNKSKIENSIENNYENQIERLKLQIDELETTANKTMEQGNIANLDAIENSVSTLQNQVSILSSKKQNNLVAGDNITIQNNVISSTNTTYTAGENISINNGVISSTVPQIDTSNFATKTELSAKQNLLTAGENISITTNNNTTTISATNTTYTAGENINISNGVISATNTTYTAGTGIDITNGVISSTATSGLTEITASDVNSESATQGQVLTADGQGGATWQTATGGSGGMTQEQETQLSAVWNYYQSLQYDPDPTYNPQTYSDYPAGTIFKTFDSYERNLEFSSTGAEIILPTIYFVAEAGSEANIFIQTKLTSTTANLNLLVSVFVNSTLVSQETTTISAGETKVYEKTIYGIALNQTAKNNNMYIRIERNGSGTIVCTHEKVEIVAPNADIFNKISPYSVEYIGGQYYVADCSDGTAKLATIAVEDMHNIQNLQFENLGFGAEHLAIGRNTQNYNNTYFYDSTFYVYKTKKNETIVNVPATNKTYRISPTFETFDWEFAKTTNCFFMGVRKPETAKYFIYYTSGNYAGVGGVNSKFSNIESISPCKKMIADPSNINPVRIYTQITDCGEVYISFDDKKTDACNVCLGYGTSARVFLKSLTSSYNFAVDVYIKRFDKIVKYEVHMSSLSTGYVIDNITTIGSYDDFVLGANDDYFVIKNGVLEYHKMPNEE